MLRWKVAIVCLKTYCTSRARLFISGQPVKFTCWLPLKQQHKVFKHNYTVLERKQFMLKIFQQWQNPRNWRAKCKGRRYCWWWLRQHLLVVTGTSLSILVWSNSQVHSPQQVLLVAISDMASICLVLWFRIVFVIIRTGSWGEKTRTEC